MTQGRAGSRRRARLRVDLGILAVVGLLLLAAGGAGGAALYQQFYSPSAFVQRYVDLLAHGRAADALRTPGVTLDVAVLQDSGIDPTASEALLRRAVLAPLDDAEVTTDVAHPDGRHDVTVRYRVGGVDGTTTFSVRQDGWIGVAPRWRFTRSPLAEIELSVRGSDRFSVNGFPIERSQVSTDGVDADPTAPLHLLVFTPGLYSVTVDTVTTRSSGVSVLADTALARTPVGVQAEPTAKFVEAVQEQVEGFLTDCATQEVLQPTSCPFGLQVQNRLAPGSSPKWSITAQPTVQVVPDRADWAIPPADGVAHIEVDIQSIFDGSVHRVSEDVPFQVNGTIRILPDESVSIRVGSPG